MADLSPRAVRLTFRPPHAKAAAVFLANLEHELWIPGQFAVNPHGVYLLRISFIINICVDYEARLAFLFEAWRIKNVN